MFSTSSDNTLPIRRINFLVRSHKIHVYLCCPAQKSVLIKRTVGNKFKSTGQDIKCRKHLQEITNN